MWEEVPDFQEAQSILERCESLRFRVLDGVVSLMTTDDALTYWFARCCDELRPYSALIRQLARASYNGFLSAGGVVQICGPR